MLSSWDSSRSLAPFVGRMMFRRRFDLGVHAFSSSPTVKYLSKLHAPCRRRRRRRRRAFVLVSLTIQRSGLLDARVRSLCVSFKRSSVLIPRRENWRDARRRRRRFNVAGRSSPRAAPRRGWLVVSLRKPFPHRLQIMRLVVSRRRSSSIRSYVRLLVHLSFTHSSPAIYILERNPTDLLHCSYTITF